MDAEGSAPIRKQRFRKLICFRLQMRGGRHVLCWGPLKIANLNHWTIQGQGQGYITTNNQSVNMSSYRAQARTNDQSLLSP
jgi:hypothetical protein